MPAFKPHLNVGDVIDAIVTAALDDPFFLIVWHLLQLLLNGLTHLGLGILQQN